MKSKHSVRAIFACYKLVFKSCPLLSICEIVSYLGSAIVSGLMTLVWKNLFDSISLALDDKSIAAALNAILVFGIFQVMEITFRLLGRVSTRLFGYNERVILNMRSKLYDHAASIPLINFEKKENYDAFERANSAIGNNAATKMVDYLYQTPAMIISLIIMAISLWNMSPILVCVAIISVIPVSLFHLSKGLKRFQLHQKQAADRRSKNYFWALFLSPAYIKDIRVFYAHDYFMNKWLCCTKKVNDEEEAFHFNHLKKQIIPDIFKVIGSCLGIIFSAILLLLKEITIGSFGAVINAFQNLQSSYLQLASNFQQFRKSYLFFFDYLDYLNIPVEKSGSYSLDMVNDIQLKNVWFKYPNADNYALKNISLKIKKNEHIAIVGENGSGKTTLCRIITGLYLPTSGQVNYNNYSLNDYSLSYRDAISGVFQDYIKYLIDIRSNVGFGSVDNIMNDDYIYAAMSKARTLDLLYNIDLNTQLGREYGGLELSGGQWQRLAIARGYMPQNAKLILFDEPTSSIDPLQESELFNQFMKESSNRAAIVVTHRMGATKLADRIIVLDKGEIVESGTHDELMNQNGKYANMYREQAKWYL
ncbi:MAG: ABC transporter ATP-binding protein [Clostridia bacterium]|nr:ABC transporter ATP-binding protein [Clostridia bacterium]